MRGSSPLTRGKPFTYRQARDTSGLIPAHAGKTSDLTTEAWENAAHPRSRGENRLVWSQVVRKLGSSPLTRGKLSEVGSPGR